MYTLDKRSNQVAANLHLEVHRAIAPIKNLQVFVYAAQWHLCPKTRSGHEDQGRNPNPAFLAQEEYWNVVIHDDLLATGGTACAAADLLLQLKTNILAFTFVVNLDFLDGKTKLEKYTSSIISLIDY